jgi:hypothetical protein
LYPPLSVDIDDRQMKSQDTNEYASIASVVDRENAILMKDNSAYMCSSTHSQDNNISTDYNVAYYSSNRVKHEDDCDNVYEYI